MHILTFRDFVKYTGYYSVTTKHCSIMSKIYSDELSWRVLVIPICHAELFYQSCRFVDKLLKQIADVLQTNQTQFILSASFSCKVCYFSKNVFQWNPTEICLKPSTIVLLLFLSKKSVFTAYCSILSYVCRSFYHTAVVLCTHPLIRKTILPTVKPRYLATVCLALYDGERRGWRLNEGSVSETCQSC